VSEDPAILIVEDDQGVRESLVMVLEYQNYFLRSATSGEEGLDLAASDRPDLVILDINLPGIDGLETCRRLRSRGFDGPVLMLTARRDVGDRVEGLDAGADDYLPKPFALEELLARVRALLRRTVSMTSGADDATKRLSDLTIDPAARTARRGETTIDLTKIEFDLLELFVTNANIVLSRDVIQERIWGYDDNLGSNSLEVFVSSIRKKTEGNGEPRLIHTVRGVGYVARTPS
jgi:two-component system response regulator MprA